MPALLDSYNRYPIACLTVHPPCGRKNTGGQSIWTYLSDALANSRNPAVLATAICGQWARSGLETRFPTVTHVMIGRGLVADPALARKPGGGKGTDREELTDFLAALYQGYTDFYQGRSPPPPSGCGEVWFYLIHLFDDAGKAEQATSPVPHSRGIRADPGRNSGLLSDSVGRSGDLI